MPGQRQSPIPVPAAWDFAAVMADYLRLTATLPYRKRPRDCLLHFEVYSGKIYLFVGGENLVSSYRIIW